MERPSASERVAACAVRTLARTETSMPMKPAEPDSTAPIRKPSADQPAEQHADDDEDHGAGDGDGGVLARQIGLRAFLDGGGDLLHARRARIRRHHGPHGVGAVDEREQSAADDCPHHHIHGRSPPGSRTFKRTSAAASSQCAAGCPGVAARAGIARDHAKCAAPLQHGHFVTTPMLPACERPAKPEERATGRRQQCGRDIRNGPSRCGRGRGAGRRDPR